MEMVSSEEIIAKLRDVIELDDIYVQTDDGSHFQIIAISEQFAEMSRVKKQQAIYAPLTGYIADNRIHALSIKTYSPEEWRLARKLLGFE